MSLKVGKKQLEQLSGFLPSAVRYGISAALALVYFTNWRLIANLIPYYNGQFVKDTGSGPPPKGDDRGDYDVPGCRPPPQPPADPCDDWPRRQAEFEEAQKAKQAEEAAARAAKKAERC